MSAIMKIINNNACMRVKRVGKKDSSRLLTSQGLNMQPPAKYRSKHQTKSKSNKCSINNNVNQQTEESGHSPVNPPINAQANPTNNAECNSHDLSENCNNQSVGTKIM